MALDISGATVGYDATGIKSLLLNIHADVIEDASNEMVARRGDLDQALDQVWQGESEEKFKENMDEDVKKIREALERIYRALESEVNQIGRNMGKVDQELVD